MSYPVTYQNHFPWNRSPPSAPATNRPYVEVELFGPVSSVRLWCLLDSGADHVQLPVSAANSAGIILSPAYRQTVTLASGGSSTLYQVPNVSMEIEGVAITATCCFAAGALTLLGRVTILTAFDFGMDGFGWFQG